MEYLEAVDVGKPFFCAVSFVGPHDPWDSPRKYSEPFDNDFFPAPRPKLQDEPSRKPCSWDDQKPYPDIMQEEAIALRKNYAGKVRMIDTKIRQIFQLLKDRKLYDDTLIVFTSDHGEMNGDYGRLYKKNFTDPAVKVPLVIKGLDDRKGAVCQDLVSLIDLGPTILDSQDIEPDFPMEGTSLLSNRKRESIVSQYKEDQMIFNGRWKLVINKKKPVFLFDHINDKDEHINMINSHKTI
ncbi:MAG: sulfatase-like hydrolase/transferase [Spirochaetia bacterium]|jgi:choline-sulfatase|nr:sulfatase-like hydrolase/transferase [Spirochaetia bacterium]